MRTLQPKCNNIKLKANGTSHIDRNGVLPPDRQPRKPQRAKCGIQRVRGNGHFALHGSGKPLPSAAALSYAETELQYHKALQDTGTDHGVYVRKALAFVRKMLKHISMPHSQVPPLSSIPSKDEKKNDIPADAPPMRWTGKASDLVELIYGISEMGCINGGEASLKEIASYCYKVFGVQAKGCYHIYNDIKMRKSESRTYFLDRAAEKVNKRMLQDEERERQRR